ncbi:uncharacterized protein LOC111794758 [Cucurbita pepo subsp. pepo]|uniref:uncharacterized protein LOC111794758 n=1 Tax=Cucurbita pepo subsp. pepo TaxID=3664 RepID=UPI000C9D7873|nr:uncharacterized protein LOC111794758 [Cucurbita pepo subsp. pepo]
MFQPDATRAATLGAVSHPCAEQFWLAFRRRRWRSRVGGCGAGRAYAAIASIRIRGPSKAGSPTDMLFVITPITQINTILEPTIACSRIPRQWSMRPTPISSSQCYPGGNNWQFAKPSGVIDETELELPMLRLELEF